MQQSAVRLDTGIQEFEVENFSLVKETGGPHELASFGVECSNRVVLWSMSGRCVYISRAQLLEIAQFATHGKPVGNQHVVDGQWRQEFRFEKLTEEMVG
jgi:hypothetical protein